MTRPKHSPALASVKKITSVADLHSFFLRGFKGLAARFAPSGHEFVHKINGTGKSSGPADKSSSFEGW
jgi:hypothetical protein